MASKGDQKTGNGSFVVKPVPSPGLSATPDVSIMTALRTISQGLTNADYQPVSGFVVKLPVDLNWGNPSNSLRLMVYSPNNAYTFGPFYDGYDGSNNGRIRLSIENSGGLPQGTWTFEVYGYSVAGTQTYTI